MSLEPYITSRSSREQIMRVLKMIEILKERKCIDRIELANMLGISYMRLNEYRRLARKLFGVDTYKHDLKICIENT